jgi:hypothetical protein
MDDDLFGRELGSLGDRLEAAIAQRIATERNNLGSKVNVLHVNSSGHHTLEDPMSQTDKVSTDVIDGSGRAVGGFRRRHKAVLIGASVATLAFGAAAAAAGLFSHDEIERGMPGGAVIFAGTNPVCTSGDGVVFDCLLTSPPEGSASLLYLGTVEPIVDDTSKVSGGCRSNDAAGMKWTCFIGQRAVDELIISADMLGQQQSGPSAG